MHTLVFLSTWQVLQCQPAACQALPLLPRELFPLLFKVAFMDKKTVVLRELVHRWPFPLLSFQQLLQECATAAGPCCGSGPAQRACRS